ncbi:unnamed protein product [Closterium sp. Naga37s-1]|nr:unnamed protein product [Closterium sp. Naga37s-1]
MAAAAPGGDDDGNDYMGDLSAFLPPEDASNLRDQQQQRQQRQKKPAKPAPRQRPDDWKMLTWQERRQQARAEKDKAEAAVLAEGLAAPIPPTNIGFKLLQKMGFKGPPAAQQMGGKAGDEEWEEVEERRGEVAGGEENGEGGEGGEAGEVPLDDIVSEELLLLALQRLRHKHFYCIHCGCQVSALLLPGGCSVAARWLLCCFQYESEDALTSMWPGEDEEAH